MRWFRPAIDADQDSLQETDLLGDLQVKGRSHLAPEG